MTGIVGAPRAGAGLVGRYALIGLLNTAIGWSVTFALDLALRCPPWLANTLGFAAGISVSFLLHRRLFAGRGGVAETARYAAAVALAFSLNQGVLRAAGLMLQGQGDLGRALAQALAMASYSVAFFILNRWWVFRGPAAAPPTD